MISDASSSQSLGSNSIIRTAIAWLIDYFRWSQMIPMFVVWIFVLFGLAGMTLVNFQEQTINGIDAVFSFWESQTWLPQYDESWLDPVSEEDGSIHLGGEDFKAMAFKVWAGLSLVLLVFDLLRRWLFGPPDPPRLGRQLLIAAVAASLVFVGFLLNYLFGSEDFNGGPAGWLFMFFGFALIAWLASAYSLVVNYALGKLSRMVNPPATAQQEFSPNG